MNSAKLAFSDFGIDRINDRPVEIIEEDNRSNPQTAKSAEEKLATVNKAWIGQAGGYTMPEFAELAGKDANLIFSTTNWNPKAAWEGTLNGIKWSGKKYSDEYVEKYDTEPDYHGAQGYAAGQIAVDALLRAAEAGNTINRESIRDALDNTDLTTVMGVIKHHKWTDEMGHHYYHQGLPPTYVIQWQDMAQEVVWPEDAASVDYIFPAPLLEQ